MNYDTSKLPTLPNFFNHSGIITSKYYSIISRITNALIYIGKGTNPPIAHIYNNDLPFTGAYIAVAYDHTIQEAFDLKNEAFDGSDTMSHYFLPKDSPILPKMFPIPQPQPHSILSQQDKDFLASLLIINSQSHSHKDKLLDIIQKLTPTSHDEFTKEEILL